MGEPPILEYRRNLPATQKRVVPFGRQMVDFALLAMVWVVASALFYNTLAMHWLGPGLLLWCGIGLACLGRRIYSQSDDPRWAFSPQHKRAVLGLLLITLLVMPLTMLPPYICPHGINFYNAHFGITWSDSGGPCGNFRRGPSHRISTHWYVYWRS